MGKRYSDAAKTIKTSKSKTVKTNKNDDPISIDSINDLTSQLLESDSINTHTLREAIGLYDSLLTQFETEEGLSRYENNARLLNIQLFKLFGKLFNEKKLSSSSISAESIIYRQLYELYKFNLLFFLENVEYDCSLIIDNLDIYMKLLRSEAVHFAPVSKESKEANPYFPTKTYRDLLLALLKASNGEVLGDGTNSNIVVQEFVDKYVKKYHDLQFYFVSELPIDDLKESSINDEVLFSKFLTVLKEKLTTFENERSFVHNLPSIVTNENHFKSEFEKKWLYFLNKSLSSDQYKTTLLILHKRIIPFFKRPTNLMDFLTDSYDLGGIISILSLNGLFELIRKYNLDYPNFYTKLYSLFDETLLHVKYRSRFLRLTDLFLSSTHLAASLVASFIKKIARLAISASPAAIVSIIPFIYNLLKRHPTTMVLLQNEHTDEYNDPFDNGEKDPAKTNAIESSLWELETLQSHYHPNVATLAKIFSQPFRKQSYNMEDFLDWSYASLLESEKTRKLKTEVALEYESFESMLGDYLKWKW